MFAEEGGSSAYVDPAPSELKLLSVAGRTCRMFTPPLENPEQVEAERFSSWRRAIRSFADSQRSQTSMEGDAAATATARAQPTRKAPADGKVRLLSALSIQFICTGNA